MSSAHETQHRLWVEQLGSFLDGKHGSWELTAEQTRRLMVAAYVVLQEHQVNTVWDSGTCADVKADLRPRIAARVVEAERRGAELAAFSRPVSPSRQAAQDTERWRTAFIACSLTANGLGERIVQWRQLVAGARREEIDDGLRLTLPAELFTPAP